MTGASTQFGAYGGDLTSSGDLVSVAGFGTVATVKHGTTGHDFLARIDPNTGTATIIGDTGFQDIWGVGRPTFELFTIGTLVVIALLAVVGYVWERNRRGARSAQLDDAELAAMVGD